MGEPFDIYRSINRRVLVDGKVEEQTMTELEGSIEVVKEGKLNIERLGDIASFLTSCCQGHGKVGNEFVEDLKLYVDRLNAIIIEHQNELTELFSNKGLDEQHPEYLPVAKWIFQAEPGITPKNMDKLIWSVLTSKDIKKEKYTGGNHLLFDIMSLGESILTPDIIKDIYEKCTYKQDYFIEDGTSMKSLGRKPFDIRWLFLYRDDVNPFIKQEIIREHYNKEELSLESNRSIIGTIALHLEYEAAEYLNKVHPVDTSESQIVQHVVSIKDENFYNAICKSPELRRGYEIYASLYARENDYLKEDPMYIDADGQYTLSFLKKPMRIKKGSE